MRDDVAIVTVSGELDFARCIELAPELNAALRSAARAIVFDLEAVSLVDSSGIALLLNAFRRLDTRGASSQSPARVGPPRRAFELTALDRQLPVRDPPRRAGCLGAS